MPIDLSVCVLPSQMLLQLSHLGPSGRQTVSKFSDNHPVADALIAASMMVLLSDSKQVLEIFLPYLDST